MPIGTPIEALAVDSDFGEEADVRFKRRGEPLDVSSRRRVLEGLQRVAWAATKAGVLKPLAVTAPLARGFASLTLEQLVRLMPEHVVSEIAVAAGSFAAKSAALATGSKEGLAAMDAAERLLENFLDCVSTEQGEKVVFESAEALGKFAKSLKSQEALDFYDSLESAGQAALQLAAAPEASKVLSDCRGTVDAAVDLFASDASLAALDEAAANIADALHTRRQKNNKKVDIKRLLRTPLNELDDTLSECDSDTEETTTTARRATTRPLRRLPKKKSHFSLCLTFVFFIWAALGIFGFMVLTDRIKTTLLTTAAAFDRTTNNKKHLDTPYNNLLPNDAPRPLKACTFDSNSQD